MIWNKNCVPNLSEIIRKSRKLSLRNAYCLILKSKAKQVNKKKAQIEVKSSLLMFSETWDWS